MKVSLIVTTFNNPVFLKKVTDSILCQTLMPSEVIIADDGSGDDTAAVVEAFARKATCPVIHVWQENKGFRAAMIRNRAIKKTAANYIILLDGDCVIDRHFIADHCSLAEKGCFIQGKRIHVNRSIVDQFDADIANSLQTLLKLTFRCKISNSHHLLRLPRYFAISNQSLKGVKSCNMSFFRQDVFAVNGFNEDYVGWGNEDSDLACRFFKYGLSKKVHPFMANCFHLSHPVRQNSASSNNTQLLRAAAAADEFFCKNGLLKEGAQAEKEGDIS